MGGIAAGVVDTIIEVIGQLWFRLKRQVACWAACASAAHGHCVHLQHHSCQQLAGLHACERGHVPLHWPALTGLAAACSTHAATLASIDWPGSSLRPTSSASSDWLCSSAVLLPAMA